MKSIICALIILCTVILSTVFIAVHTDKILTNFSNTIDKISDTPEDAISDINAVRTEYESIKPFLILFIRENEIKETEMYIEDMKSAAKEKDKSALTEAKSRLNLHTQQIKRLYTFSMEAIF